MRFRHVMGNRVLPFAAISIAGLFLLAASIDFSNYTQTRIQDLVTLNVHSGAALEADDLSHILANKLQGIGTSLRLISQDSALQTHNVTEAAPLLASAQNSTSDLTSSYFWMDGGGTLVFASNGSVKGTTVTPVLNYSQQSYFVEAQQSGQTVYSGPMQSVISNITHLVIAQPIFGSSELGGTGPKSFEGIVGAAIRLPALGTYLRSQLSSNEQGSVGILDPKGVILFSSNESMIGLNVFSDAVQMTLPQGINASLDAFIKQSLSGQNGIVDLTYLGMSSTIASQQVEIPSGVANQSVKFGIVYVIIPNNLATGSGALIGQTDVLSTTVTIGIGVLAIGAAGIIFSWNRRLDGEVKAKTAELATANVKLTAIADSQMDFVNIAAHELRTPIQSILTNAEMLQDAVTESSGSPVTDYNGPRHGQSTATVSASGAGPTPADETIETMVASVLRNANRLKKLADDILSVSKIEGSKLKLETELFDVNEKIREVIGEIRRSEASSGGAMISGNGQVVLDSSQLVLQVRADPAKIQEVLSNLISNAIKFSQGQGTIKVTSGRTEDGGVIVSVRDNGPGIDPEMAPRLFTKFSTNSPSGTGLGLFISKRIVEAHGGRMWAENNPGNERGSTFWFTLPPTS
jgi:signal transduction histidine kinase